MSALRSRLATLEAALNSAGSLLLSWRLDPESRAMCEYDCVTYTQGDDESRDVFLRRVSDAVSARAAVWVDQLDERL